MAVLDEASQPFLSDPNAHDDSGASASHAFSNAELEHAYSPDLRGESSRENLAFSRWRLPGWWWRESGVVVRPRRKFEVNEDAIIGDMGLKGGRRGRGIGDKRGVFSWCVFGSVSGLTILTILLTTNLFITATTLYYTSDWESPLRHWGAPGTTSEGLSWYPTDFLRDVNPLPCHSHNDYWRRVPLFSALLAGCTGIEADVWLYNNELYIGHNTASLARNRTFQSLYVNPLVEILSHQNPSTEFYNASSHGIFDTSPEKSVTLLVDLKTSGPLTWPVVLQQLEPLRERDWLTFVRDGVVHQRPVTVVGTGNTPFDILTANSTYRDAFFDAPLDTMWQEEDTNLPILDDGEGEDSGSGSDAWGRDQGQGHSGISPSSAFNATNSFYASTSFGATVGIPWRGRLSAKQMRLIRGQIRGAHARGLQVRYWDTPAWPRSLRDHVWAVLVREGADMLNVDDLRAMQGVW